MANSKLSRIASWTSALAGALVLVYSGCSLCCGPYDYDYPSFGGAVQRSNPTWGRVGSVYSDPGPFGGPGADSNLKPHDTGFDLDDEIEAIPEPGLLIEPQPDGSGTGNDTDVLPPPNPNPQNRPSPDDETRRSTIQRLQNQSSNFDSSWR